MLALALLSLGFALRPRARLKVTARGFAPLDDLERYVLEYTRVLSRLLNERCGAESGCLVVEVQWEPPRYLNDAAVQMSLRILNETHL